MHLGFVSVAKKFVSSLTLFFSNALEVRFRAKNLVSIRGNGIINSYSLNYQIKDCKYVGRKCKDVKNQSIFDTDIGMNTKKDISVTYVVTAYAP